MAELFSQYSSGVQFTAGTIAGSTLGASGLNPIVDRLNSISQNDSVISGTVLVFAGSVIESPLASTSVKGVASFNTNDFSVSTGAVSLKNKTSYLSIPGNAFLPATDTDQYTRLFDGTVTADSDGILFYARANLPEGAEIQSAIVYGNAAAGSETWQFWEHATDATTTVSLASENINTAETGISTTVDNSSNDYFINTSSLDTGDIIYGAKITYTTDYD